jgi:hypothetical protein
MKRLNIILSVFFLVTSTFLLTSIPMQVSLDLGQWAVLACIVLIGYLEAYLFFDNYLNFVIREQRQDIAKAWREGNGRGYDMGHYDGYRQGRDDLKKEQSQDSMDAIVDQDLIDLGQF